METEIISDLAVFSGMKEEWNALAARFASPLLRHEWFAACIDAFGSRRNPLAIFVVRANGHMRAIAPFMIVHRAGVPQLETLGGYHLGEPCGFLYDGDEALNELIETIFRSRKSFALLNFATDSLEIRMLRQNLPKRTVCLDRTTGSSLRVSFDDPWNDFEASISKRCLSKLRRCWRRAERLGEVELEVVRPNRDTLVPPLAEFFRVEASGWKGRGGSAILSSPPLFHFFSQYAQAATQEGLLRFLFFKIGGETAAARMAVECGDCLWGLKIGYDEAFGRCAPGILLTHETLRYANDCGLKAYAFLGREEPWENVWNTRYTATHNYVSLKAYPLSVTGSLSFFQDGYRFALRRAHNLFGKATQEICVRHATSGKAATSAGGVG